MKIRTAVALAGATAMLVAACSPTIDDDAAAPVAPDPGAAEEDPNGGQPEGGPTIHFVSHTQDITEMAGQQIIGIETQFADAGFAYTLNTAAPPAAEAHEVMDRILQDIATASPDYMVINPSSWALVDGRVAEIEAAGTKVVAASIDPNVLTEPATADPLAWIAVDEYAMGYNGAEWVAQQWCAEGPDSVKIAPFYGPAASEISQQRLGGALDAFNEVLGGCAIEIVWVDDVYADFEKELAFNYAETVATGHPDLDLIVGANSNTALGVMESLSAQNRLDDVLVLGMGGQLDELAAICRGDIYAAGFRDALQMGYDVADVIMADWAGEWDQHGEVVLSDIPVTHDCDTVFEYVPSEMLEQDGFRTNIPDGMWEEYTS